MANDDVLCTTCLRAVKRPFEDHVGSIECQINQLDDEAIKEGLEMILVSARLGKGDFTRGDHSDLRMKVSALEAAGIKHKVVEHSAFDKSFSYMALWAPTWLAQALKNYQAGYADLTLAEYLSQVKP